VPRRGRWTVLVLGLLCLLGLTAVAASPATASVTTAPAVAAPTAAIGEFDCARLRVPIRLDNSRSTDAVTFGYSAAFTSPLHQPYSGTDARVDVELAAGERQVIELPVRDNARTDVTVHLPDGGHVVSQGACGNAPRATFGLARCDTLRLPVTLDNSTSRRPVRYRWAAADAAGPLVSRSVEVDAGAVVGVDVPLVPDGWTEVAVTLDGAGPVASSDRQACGRAVVDPRASFGVVDCADVSAPVLLDNSRTTTRLRFLLPGLAMVVGAGETRSLRLHLPVREQVAVTTDDPSVQGGPTERAVTSTAHCAGVPPPSPGTAPVGPGPTPDAGTAAGEEAAAGAAAAQPDSARRATGAAREAATAPGVPAVVVVIGAGVVLGGFALGLLVMRRRGARTG
jgi:hypothetical protein